MRRIALYAHYDPDDLVRPYVCHCLSELAAQCDRVDFVTTSQLPPQELAKVEAHCERVLLKDNTGFDFGMWQHALTDIDLDSWDELVLVNSSVYGPVFPLVDAFTKMARSRCDFWSITDCYEHAWHLQSYFVVLRRTLLQSEVFERFWASVLPYRNKPQVVRSYEIGMSVFFTEMGYRGAAMVPCTALFPSWPLHALFRHRDRNPTVYHPRRLLARGAPFVKIELLRDNPLGRELKPVFRAIETTGYDCSLIEECP